MKEFKRLGIEHQDYDHTSIQAFKLIQAGYIDQALSMLPKIETEQADLDHGLVKLLVEVQKFTGQAAITAERHEQLALKLMAAITGFALLIGMSFAVGLYTVWREHQVQKQTRFIVAH